jgi:uncharacterized protein (DUF2336 family)
MKPVSDVETKHLFELARDKTVAGRKSLIDMVTDLFFANGGALSDRERALMSDILRQLIHDVENEVRHVLAERLAREATAPPDLVRALANDDIEVAHPILLRSPVLLDDELIEIIHHRTLEHQLAIAMRDKISEVVSDALVQTGNPDVVTRLLENETAQISKITLEYLVEQSKRVDTYQNPLLRRPELSPELARRMYWWVSAALRKDILERFAIEESELDDALEETVGHLAGEPTSEPDPASKSLLLAAEMARRQKVTPALLLQTLRQGEIALFEALFSKLSNIRLTLVRRLLFEPGGEGLAIACKALDFSAPDFATLFVLTRKARPNDGALGRGDVTHIVGFYNSIQKRAALQLLKKWQRSTSYLRAVWAVDQTTASHAAS